MARDELGSSPTLRCGHCGNRAPMQVRARDSRITRHETDPSDTEHLTWEAGSVFEVLMCPACHGTLLATYEYHEFLTPEGVEYQLLYPNDRGLPVGLPDAIAKSYNAAQTVRSIEANAFGVLLRRVLELVCSDRNAQGRTLNQQLQDLARRNEIPEKLVNVANSIRNLGNVGAHPGLGELTSSEVPILDDLTRAILEYVYSAPLLARRAEERLAQLRSGPSAAGRVPPSV
jgi:hypothetical protein